MKIAWRRYRARFKHLALSLGIEFGADVFDIAFPINQTTLDGGLRGDEARGDQLARALRRQLARRRDRLDNDFLPVGDDRLHALAQRGRHRVAAKGLGRTLVLFPLQRLRLDFQLVERALEKNAAGRDAQHR